MAEQSREGDVIKGTVTGPVSGQVAIGKGITQSQTTVTSGGISEAELNQLRAALEAVRTQVRAETPPELQPAALERVDELQQAVTDEKPDLTTMEYVRNWFAKNVPALAGAVTSVIVNPIVGKLVEAAGEAASEEFRRRFGAG
jgi:hypothetical protein